MSVKAGDQADRIKLRRHAPCHPMLSMLQVAWKGTNVIGPARLISASAALFPATLTLTPALAYIENFL